MISNISFGSTYRVSSDKNGFDKFHQFQKYALNKEMNNEAQIQMKDNMDKKYPYHYGATYTLVAPDSLDNEVEAYCAINGIEFEKMATDGLMKPRAILNRIEEAPKGYRKVMVDVEKLEEMLINQHNNFGHCEDDYDLYYQDKVEFMLKSGDEIPATTLNIIDCSNPTTSENVLKYIDRFGADRLNNEQLFVTFNQETDKPDHCVYFALRNMGLKSVPMYVNKVTYEIGNALEIFR